MSEDTSLPKFGNPYLSPGNPFTISDSVSLGDTYSYTSTGSSVTFDTYKPKFHVGDITYEPEHVAELLTFLEELHRKEKPEYYI